MLAFIPEVITSSSSPIAEAAIIKLKREEIRKPPDRAFFMPNSFCQSNDGKTFIAKSDTNNKTKKPIREESNSAKACGSKFAPTIIKKKGIKKPKPIPSNLISINERSR